MKRWARKLLRYQEPCNAEISALQEQLKAQARETDKGFDALEASILKSKLNRDLSEIDRTLRHE